jgi:hypothetical protein
MHAFPLNYYTCTEFDDQGRKAAGRPLLVIYGILYALVWGLSGANMLGFKFIPEG